MEKVEERKNHRKLRWYTLSITIASRNIDLCCTTYELDRVPRTGSHRRNLLDLRWGGIFCHAQQVIEAAGVHLWAWRSMTLNWRWMKLSPGTQSIIVSSWNRDSKIFQDPFCFCRFGDGGRTATFNYCILLVFPAWGLGTVREPWREGFATCSWLKCLYSKSID